MSVQDEHTRDTDYAAGGSHALRAAIARGPSGALPAGQGWLIAVETTALGWIMTGGDWGFVLAASASDFRPSSRYDLPRVDPGRRGVHGGPDARGSDIGGADRAAPGLEQHGPTGGPSHSGREAARLLRQCPHADSTTPIGVSATQRCGQRAKLPGRLSRMMEQIL